MSRIRLLTIFIVIVLAVVTACQSKEPPLIPATPPDIADQVLQANLHELSGGVQARQPGQDGFVPAQEGMLIQIGGQVSTQEDGRARIDLSTGTIIRLTPLSLFTLEDNGVASQGGLMTRLKLQAGKIWIILRGGQMDVETPSGVASVRGSYMSVEVLPDGTLEVTCLEGTCRLSNAAGSVELTAGQKANVTGPNDPPKTGLMSADEFQKWLDENPEAALVIPEVLPTEPPPSTESPATEAPLPTEPPVVPTATFTPVPYVPPAPPTKPPKPPETPDPPETEVPENTPSTFTDAIGPTGTLTQCDNNYSVKVSDPEGVSSVHIKFKAYDALGSLLAEYLFDIYPNGSEYSGSFVIYTADEGVETVVWQFKAFDSAGVLTLGPSGTFTDEYLDCPGY